MVTLVRFLALGIAALALQSCAPSRPTTVEGVQAALVAMGPTEATQALRNAYEFISDNYLGEPRLDDFGKAGLRNLTELDPALSLRDDRSTVTLLLDGRPIHSFEPPPYDRPDAWANTVRRAVEAASAESPALAGEGWGQRVDTVLYGAASALDPYSFYRSFNSLVRLEEAFRDKPGAVGISFIQAHSPQKQIAQVRFGSKAEEAGLEAGNVVEEVNGEPVEELSLIQLQAQLAGPLETSVIVKARNVSRGELKTFAVAREEIDYEEPVAQRKGPLLYLQLGRITDKTTEKAREIIEADLAKGSGRATGIILDLRGTSGSQPWLARGLMEFFVSEVSVFTSEGRTPTSGDWYPSWETPVLPDVPLVVLQNGATRTSAEAVAAAIEDLGRGIVIGTVTRGQGRVPRSTYLPNSGLLSVSWSDTYSWAKYRISGRGVLPVICTAGEASVDALLSSLRRGEGITAWPERTKQINPSNKTVLQAHRALCPAIFASSDRDIELAKAILADRELYDRILQIGQRGKPPPSEQSEVPLNRDLASGS